MFSKYRISRPPIEKLKSFVVFSIHLRKVIIIGSQLTSLISNSIENSVHFGARTRWGRFMGQRTPSMRDGSRVCLLHNLSSTFPLSIFTNYSSRRWLAPQAAKFQRQNALNNRMTFKVRKISIWWPLGKACNLGDPIIAEPAECGLHSLYRFEGRWPYQLVVVFECSENKVAIVSRPEWVARWGWWTASLLVAIKWRSTWFLLNDIRALIAVDLLICGYYTGCFLQRRTIYIAQVLREFCLEIHDFLRLEIADCLRFALLVDWST